MNKSSDPIDNLRVASPCGVSWQSMTGDAKSRYCRLCELNVYNFSEMSAGEIRAVITDSGGRLCARMYRRADGTVMTKDCPVSVRAVRRRVARFAGAALSAILSMCGAVTGQTRQKQQGGKECTVTELRVRRIAVTGQQPQQQQRSEVAGTVTDANGAVVVGAKVTVTSPRSDFRASAVTTEEGAFSFPALSEGEYAIEVESSGFKKYRAEKLALNRSEGVQVEVELQAQEELMGVIVITEPSLLDRPSGETIFSGDLIRKLPL